MKKTQKCMLFWTLMFIGALLVLSRIGYSDGDDVFFYQNTRSRGFFEYLSWRYETWVGRMAGEAMVYLVFRHNIWLWRIVNALMLVLLPIGLIRLAEKAARLPEGGIVRWYERIPVKREAGFALSTAVTAVMGYFLMAATTLGYAAVWMNGSIFYTWSFTCGIWAMMPLADLVFQTGKFRRRQLFYSVPCAVIASMSIEQMAAVLLVFEVLGALFLFWKERKIPWELLLQTAVTAAAFCVLFLAPGNELRVASEVTNWMPQYNDLTTGEHLFITVQWLLSSFANENKLFLCALWVMGILLLLQQKEKKKQDFLWIAAAGIFTAAALLPFAGVTVLSDMGMDIGDIMLPVEQVPVVSDLTGQNVMAMLWWTAALLFTFGYLWKVSGFQVTLLLAYLAGIASEAILYCSPTMYASGARVYYLTDLLYLFIILTLSLELHEKRWRIGYSAGMVCAGAVHFVFQLHTFAMWLW
ncbi:MAG: hypothetical protein J5986_10110 [Roseburia sp.]|nr:hypothetical protein [Roseburia sp.]